MAWPAGYTLLPGLVGGTGAYANGVSADGSVVVGEADDSGGLFAGVGRLAPQLLCGHL